MASDLNFVEYVVEQLGAGITYKRMFGEYGIYCDGKIVGVICDNVLYIKKTEAGAKLYPSCAEGAPYGGAKPHFIIDNVDDKEFMAKFVRATYEELPAQKPKKAKSKCGV